MGPARANSIIMAGRLVILVRDDNRTAQSIFRIAVHGPLMNGFQAFLANKSRVSLQFVKYGVAGVFATGTYVATFSLLNESVLPAGSEQLGSARGWNFFFSNVIAFLMANVVGYLANRAWVFQPGRHGQGREFLMFCLVSAVAFFLGTPLGSLIVASLAINEYFVLVPMVALSIMVNFLGRKYLVFLH